MEEKILEKYSNLIQACKKYYIDSVPTGYSDAEYDEMEREALRQDSFNVRDYVFNTYMQGVKVKNEDYITKFQKEKISKTMIETLRDFEKESQEEKLYYNLKYDGSSIAIYLNPKTGEVKEILTAGNLTSDLLGISQIGKFWRFMPKKFPLGIKAIQCEALVEISLVSDKPERARQICNGLINSKYKADEVGRMLTLRAYRYFPDLSMAEGKQFANLDYRDALSQIPCKKDPSNGRILFCPAETWTLGELEQMNVENYITKTSTGTFLNDGIICYNNHGVIQKGFKYPGAGAGDKVITSKVLEILWNNQVPKGKDSWSANVRVDPVELGGTTVRKPSAGSISKLVEKKITPGAEISLILANSTIPMVGDCISPGNGDYQWPTCGCGHQFSEKDVFGALLKCTNPLCSERIARMREYLKSCTGLPDLNKFLVIDRFKWEKTGIDISKLLEYVIRDEKEEYHKYLDSFMKTALQKRNLEVVWQASWQVLREHVKK